MDYGNKCSGDSMGHNKGLGNRGVASHIKEQHNNAGKSGNSVSSMIRPSRSMAHAPGAGSYAKTPRATSRPIDD